MAYNIVPNRKRYPNVSRFFVYWFTTFKFNTYLNYFISVDSGTIKIYAYNIFDTRCEHQLQNHTDTPTLNIKHRKYIYCAISRYLLFFQFLDGLEIYFLYVHTNISLSRDHAAHLEFRHLKNFVVRLLLPLYTSIRFKNSCIYIICDNTWIVQIWGWREQNKK